MGSMHRHHGKLPLFLLGLLAALPPAAPAAETGAREYYAEGVKCYRKGEFKEALTAMSNALLADSQFTLARAARAQARNAMGDRSGMLHDAAEGLKEIRARDAETYTARGDLRLLSGDLVGARADFDEALRLDQEHVDALVGRGKAGRAAGDFAAAVADLRQALTLEPRHLMARYHLGRALYESGQPAAAKKEFAAILEANVEFFLAHDMLGVLYAGEGDFTRSHASYSTAILLQPEHPFAYLGRALVDLKTGKLPQAEKDFESAIHLDLNDYAPLYNRGEVRIRRGEKEAGLADFRATLKLDIPDFTAASTMARRFLDASRFDDGVKMYSKVLDAVKALGPSRRPEATAEALRGRAASLHGLGADARALEDLNAAIRISSGAPQFWTARGELQMGLNQDAAALADFDQALALSQSFAPALLGRGTLRMKQREYQQALKDLGAAIQADPALAPAYDRRGRVYAEAVEDFDRAVEDLEKAVALDRGNAVFHLDLGKARLRQGSYLGAIDSLSRALALKAPPGTTHRYLAEAQLNLGDVAQAEGEIAEGLKKDPRSAELTPLLGLVYIRQRSAAMAIRHLDEIIARDASNASAFLYRGLAYGALGEYPRASEDLERAASLSPDSLSTLAFLCQARRLDRQPKRALDACDDALAKDPEFVPALVQRGLSFLALGEFARAAADLDAADRLGPRTPQTLLARAVTHASLGQYQQADRAYREAVSIDPLAKSADLTLGEDPGTAWDFQSRIMLLEDQLSRDASDPYAAVLRGDSLHSAGYYARAILEYTKAMEADPKLTAAYLGRAATLEAQGSLDAAEQDLRRAVELSSGDFVTHNALITLLTGRRKLPEAFDLALEALRLQGKDPQAETYVRAGNIRYFMKMVDLAANDYRQAIALSPSLAAAHNGLGLCEFGKGRLKQAVAHFSRAIELHPDYDPYYRNRASAYVNMRLYENAANDYKLALAVNRDPEMVQEYQRLIKSSVARQKSDAPKKKAARSLFGESGR